MSWLRKSEPHFAVSIEEARFTQAEVRLSKVYLDATSNAQRFPSPAAVPEPVDKVSPRYRARWPDARLRVPLFPWTGPPTVQVQLWARKRRRRTYLGSVEYRLSDLVGSTGAAAPGERLVTLPAVATLFPQLNIKVDLRVSVEASEDALDTWRLLASEAAAQLASDTADSDAGGPTSSDDYVAQLAAAAEASDSEGSVLGRATSRPQSVRSGKSGLSALTTLSSTLSLTSTAVGGGSSRAGSAPPGPGTAPSAAAKSTSRRRRREKSHFKWDTGSDAIGVVYLEIVAARNLPRFKTLTGFSFDMDPFVVISFGRRTFKTPYRRHTLNPTFDQKLLFLVEKQEKNYDVTFTIWDKDKVTLNDEVAVASMSVREIMEHAPERDPKTGLYQLEDYAPRAVQLPCVLVDGAESRSRFSAAAAAVASVATGATVTTTPEMHVNVHYLPYGAVRQQLWRGIIAMYDGEEAQGLNYVQLMAMLNSLGSTLSKNTVRGFFRRFNPDEQITDTTPTLQADEIVMCIEDHLAHAQIVPLAKGLADFDLGDSDAEGAPFEIPTASLAAAAEAISATRTTSPAPTQLSESALGPPGTPGLLGSSFGHHRASRTSLASSVPSSLREAAVERVIALRVCPICQQPQLGRYSELESMRHVSLCASKHWSGTDVLLLDDRYVTRHQASRRWYSRIMSKLSFGSYQLGANSANILVQDRITGQIDEEKMSPAVRLGIRLLYATGPVERRRLRRLLEKYTLKQGIKYDSPVSASSIKPFIKFHNLDMSDVLLPVSSFRTFNEFFYRQLKPGARPCENGEEPRTAVSLADCRLTLFPTVDDAKRVWIKGKQFGVRSLLGDTYPDDVARYEKGGSLAIFRLAPQDYHRFHIPVDGVLGEPKHIPGFYYTVNPMAIRSSLDVYGLNARTVVPLESPEFGRVMIVLIGAMMVGGIVVTAKVGQRVTRADELGYFRFGGSTCVVLFEPGRIQFDSDIVANSASAIETLVRVGMSIGHTPDAPEYTRRYDTRQQTIKRAQTAITGGGSYMPFSLD